MQCSNVALWLTPFSWWPNVMHADAASLAVVLLMPMHDFRRLSQGTVMAMMAPVLAGGIWNVRKGK